jgi:HPt (histidine-containing phosphotransfer) domain-containing protein
MDLPKGVLSAVDFDSLVTAMRGADWGPVDVSHIDELNMGEGSYLGELIPILGEAAIPQILSTLLKDFPSTIARLRRAAITGDINALREAAHYLKSGARQVDARQIGELSAILELAAGRELPPKPWTFLTSATAQLICAMLDFQEKYGK